MAGSKKRLLKETTMVGNNKCVAFLQRYGMVIARIFIALIFLGAAFHKITGFQGTLGYMKSQMGALPDGVLAFLLVGAIVFLVVGGLGVLFGAVTRFGALLLIIFLLSVTPIFHAFWAVPAEQVQMQLINFQKNLALIGGLISVMAFGPGQLSVDYWWAKRCKVCGTAVSEECGCQAIAIEV
jgi:putative oxidoreductase